MHWLLKIFFDVCITSLPFNWVSISYTRMVMMMLLWLLLRTTVISLPTQNQRGVVLPIACLFTLCSKHVQWSSFAKHGCLELTLVVGKELEETRKRSSDFPCECRWSIGMTNGPPNIGFAFLSIWTTVFFHTQFRSSYCRLLYPMVLDANCTAYGAWCWLHWQGFIFCSRSKLCSSSTLCCWTIIFRHDYIHAICGIECFLLSMLLKLESFAVLVALPKHLLDKTSTYIIKRTLSN